MSSRRHGYPWPTLATSPYHSSPPAGLQSYILCPLIVAVCKFELVVLLLHGHMWGSIGVHHLWARPCKLILLANRLKVNVITLLNFKLAVHPRQLLLHRDSNCCIVTNMIHIQLFPYTCGNIVNTIMTNEHSSLEKYTSHTLFEMIEKGLRKGYVWEVSWRLNRGCNILTPSSSVFSSTSFSFCWAAQPRALRAQPSAETWFSQPRTATTDSKLTEPICGPGLYNCLTYTCFSWASPLHPIQPVHSQGYTLISSTRCTCSLIDGWVEGQYVT